MIKNLAMVTALSLAASAMSACGGAYDEEGDEVLDEESVAESSEALTNVDHCVADGLSTPNAVSHISSAETSEGYTRLWQFIDTICPASRDTTSVEFKANTSLNHQYRFVVNPVWWTATNPVQCMNLTLASRVQRHDEATGDWVTVRYQELNGVWNFGTNKCQTPQFQYVRNSNGETDAYRLRTWALQWDGVSHATVGLIGSNSGPP